MRIRTRAYVQNTRLHQKPFSPRVMYIAHYRIWRPVPPRCGRQITYSPQNFLTALEWGTGARRFQISPNPPMDTDGRCEDTGRGARKLQKAMVRARIRVDGRFGGDLQALWGAPMAAYSGCGEGDGGIGHGRGARGPDWRELAGTFSWRTGAVRLGGEWLAAGPGRD